MRSFDEIHTDMKAAIRRLSTKSLLEIAEEFEELGTDFGRAWGHNARGTHASRTGVYHEALVHLNSSLDLFRSIDSELSDVSSLLSNLGTVHSYLGEYDKAAPLFREALVGFELKHDLENAANVYLNLGAISYYQASYVDALEMFHRALDNYQQIEGNGGVIAALGNIGSTYLQVGEYPAALSYFFQVLDHTERLGLTHLSGEPLTNIGTIYLKMGNDEEALQYQHRALDLFTSPSDPHRLLGAERCIGQVYVARDDYAEAATWFLRSVDNARSISARAELAQSLVELSDAYVRLGRVEEATSVLDEHATILGDYPAPAMSTAILRARIQLALGEHDSARTLLLEALQNATACDMKQYIMISAELLRDLAKEQRDFDGYLQYEDLHKRMSDETNGAAAARKFAVQERDRALAQERAKLQRELDLLHATLPQHVADRVARGEVVNDAYDNAAVLFMDIAGFTTHSSSMQPQETTALLADIFRQFDEICERHDVTKIKTIGDSYMAAAFPDNDPCIRLANAAREMMSLSFFWPDKSPLSFRIGMHNGPVVAGVIGTQRLQYDVWGDTVNVASRMESTGEPGRIHVSEAFAIDLKSNTEYRIQNSITESENAESLDSSLLTSHLTSHSSLVTSHLTSHSSLVTSHLTPHLSPVTSHFTDSSLVTSHSSLDSSLFTPHSSLDSSLVTSHSSLDSSLLTPHSSLDSSLVTSHFSLQLRGSVDIKGKGSMTTYWLERA